MYPAWRESGHTQTAELFCCWGGERRGDSSALEMTKRVSIVSFFVLLLLVQLCSASPLGAWTMALKVLFLGVLSTASVRHVAGFTPMRRACQTSISSAPATGPAFALPHRHRTLKRSRSRTNSGADGLVARRAGLYLHRLLNITGWSRHRQQQQQHRRREAAGGRLTGTGGPQFAPDATEVASVREENQSNFAQVLLVNHSSG